MGSRVMLYRREGLRDAPHEHARVLIRATKSDATDGLDATALPLPGFPHGLLVMMNSGAKNFLMYDLGALLGK
jgi:hypothetical protein